MWIIMLPRTAVHWQSSVGVGDKFGVEQLVQNIAHIFASFKAPNGSKSVDKSPNIRHGARNFEHTVTLLRVDFG